VLGTFDFKEWAVLKNDMMYWALIGVAFAATLIVGAVMMKKTNKFGLSFLSSTAINLVVTVIAILWFTQTNEDPSRKNFGIIVYGIAFVNLAIINAFILFSMRNKGDAQSFHSLAYEQANEEDKANGKTGRTEG
jgi:hypothetical protein